ncbi:FAD:protein FMN transferase [Alcanivorax sp. 1008]|uniref:FAD:protein FMN transferase n=1 Tax=Alcanivorax sp. 1008 TaxID=2816853 RepID=UPI001E00BB7C|nr:FAD:protein FMN transferase [Alcanivorax sp. 1008]MCC1496681.1 FAD:protein FMN transferase [Alcanivorax sp. 1008]
MIMRSPLLILLLCLWLPAQAQWHSDSWDSMGTRATLEFWHQGDHGKDITEAIRQEFNRIENQLSPWIADSELARFNRLAVDQKFSPSDEFRFLLERSSLYSTTSNGAFDITFAGAGQLYNYRTAEAPDDAALQQTVIGMQHIHWHEDGSISKDHPSVRIDLGGIAKGYAIDRAVAILRAHNIDNAYLSLGGDSYVLGQRDGRLWQVGIRHPRNSKAVAITLPLTEIAVSTSGDYERFFVRDGEHIHHILNPHTGKPAGDIMSVTVLTGQGIDADALSTTIFVMGIEEGLALANRMPEVSAIIIDLKGKVHYSDDLTGH